MKILRVVCPMLNDLRFWPRNIINASASIAEKSDSTKIYRIDNLSAGGALLTGQSPLEVGSRYRFTLRLPGLQPVEINGRVVRTQKNTEGSHSHAVAFYGMDPDSEDLIHNCLLSQLEQHERKNPFALVVDDCVDVRRTLERELRALDVAAVLAAMPLDAIRQLRDQGSYIDIAIVDWFLGPADGMQLLKYLKVHHPHIRRILICGRHRPCQLELAVSAGHAHAAIPKPWGNGQIAEVIQRLGPIGDVA